MQLRLILISQMGILLMFIVLLWFTFLLYFFSSCFVHRNLAIFRDCACCSSFLLFWPRRHSQLQIVSNVPLLFQTFAGIYVLFLVRAFFLVISLFFSPFDKAQCGRQNTLLHVTCLMALACRTRHIAVFLFCFTGVNGSLENLSRNVGRNSFCSQLL